MGNDNLLGVLILHPFLLCSDFVYVSKMTKKKKHYAAQKWEVHVLYNNRPLISALQKTQKLNSD